MEHKRCYIPQWQGRVSSLFNYKIAQGSTVLPEKTELQIKSSFMKTTYCCLPCPKSGVLTTQSCFAATAELFFWCCFKARRAFHVLSTIILLWNSQTEAWHSGVRSITILRSEDLYAPKSISISYTHNTATPDRPSFDVNQCSSSNLEELY